MPAQIAGNGSDRLFRLPANGAPPAKQLLLLAIDERAFPLQHNVSLFLTKPTVRKEPVLVPSTSPGAPDNCAAHFNGTVLRENGRFRMWYYAVHSDPNKPNSVKSSPVCYAESADGISWTKPNLGQVGWQGSRANNCIALGEDPTKGSNGVSVIRDDSEPRPDRRYKMAYGFWDPNLKCSSIATAVSADGIRWLRQANPPSGKDFAEFASLYKHGDYYVVNAQCWANGESDRPQGRTGYAWVSTDFENWQPEPAPSFKVPEPLVGSGMGTNAKDGGTYTQVHLGVGAVSFGNVSVGLWGMWNNRQPNWGEGGIDCDLGLVVSQDGLRFDEVVKGLVYIRSTESLSDPVAGRNYPTILHQANSMFNVGNETWIYHGRWRNVDMKAADGPRNYWGAVALATLPRDRWGALTLSGKDNQSAWFFAGMKSAGSVCTSPITLPSGIAAQLTVNGSSLGGMRVEVLDDQFRPIAGFGQGSTPVGTADSLDAEVKWSGHALKELGGKTVRLRLHFTRNGDQNPRLYALNLVPRP
ncbi:MAG: hypothetical protein EXS38_04630 [Opitutus sp.]|nr:hypothetical protein [Opitutus sp.]